ncbi:MAG: bifunctional [glutamate--ammonia ligase]-adenylyl-L-tyrosine phosphorylase/[glutamate--ammonia-ligase] adenylyltransferase [Brachymonas sp.]
MTGQTLGLPGFGRKAVTIHGAIAKSWSSQAPSSFSRYASRVRRRYAAELSLLSAGAPGTAALKNCYAALRASHDVSSSLRITRALAMERLITLDCDQHADLATITGCITELAELSLQLALKEVHAQICELHGAPSDSQGQPSELWILGMGKLGARELNVSSDIDLIFVFSQDGQTTGLGDGARGSVSNQEFFQKVVRGVCQLLADVSEHGFVFRVDLALRPHGNSGPSAVSLAALEDYFLVSGREWERFAWLKSRVVAHTGSAEAAHAVREAVRPFVYRRYLDYGVFESLRQLHSQIRDHANKRAAGRPERANDVKLSRGGIRELEFIVQLLQVVRGGQFPELCTRPTLKALPRLAAAGLMPAAMAQVLSEAYVFLRRTEHRIQYLDDQQTHLLPTQDADCAWLSNSMGYQDCCGFLSALDAHREVIASEFDKLLGQDKACKGCGGNTNTGEQAFADLPPALRERVTQWLEHPRLQTLREDSRQRLGRLVQRTAQWLREGTVSEVAALRLADWLEPLLRREAYLALLLERPAVHERLLRVLGAARWPQRYLMQHPGVIDELASESLLAERFDAVQFEAELATRRTALQVSRQEDEESLMALLRRAQHAEVFRILVRDLEQRITVEQVADDLSALADSILRTTLQWAWQHFKERHTEVPGIALIAYGKLGGKELGYGSDLDIVCLYDDAHEQAAPLYAKLVRKLITWLSTKTAQGDLYDIDTALRPNGSAGLLVTSMEAFENYQTQRGSNTAWTWEHQAMTRARCVWAAPELAVRFEQVRQQVITAERDAAALKSEILAMRSRVAQAHRVPADRFDVKHSPGGMVDVEFAVQYLVLAHAKQHPSLRANSGNIALLKAAQVAGLLPTPVGEQAADAYRQMRRAQHLARLDEQTPQLPQDQLTHEKSATKALWTHVLG